MPLFSRHFLVKILIALMLIMWCGKNLFDFPLYVDMGVERLPSPSLLIRKELRIGKAVSVVPVTSTYVCAFMRNATWVPGGCVETCVAPQSDGAVPFLCYVHHSRPKTDEEFLRGDVVVSHFNEAPPPHGAKGSPYLTLYYTGESNATNTRNGNDRYHEYDIVVSMHQHRSLYFTWVQEYQEKFMHIVNKNTQGEGHTIDSIWSDWQARLPAIAVFISNCNLMRRRVIKLLSSAYDVHSFALCNKNKNMSQKCKSLRRYEQKMCVFHNYKYVLCMENTKETDYVTEKVYHALLGGAIPLYWGAPNIEQFVPAGRKSFIDIDEYLSVELKKNQNFSMEGSAARLLLNLGDRLRRLETDRAAVLGLLEWRLARRTEEWGNAFWNNLHHTDPICDICAEAHRRRSKALAT